MPLDVALGLVGLIRAFLTAVRELCFLSGEELDRVSAREIDLEVVGEKKEAKSGRRPGEIPAGSLAGQERSKLCMRASRRWAGWQGDCRQLLRPRALIETGSTRRTADDESRPMREERVGGSTEIDGVAVIVEPRRLRRLPFRAREHAGELAAERLERHALALPVNPGDAGPRTGPTAPLNGLTGAAKGSALLAAANVRATEEQNLVQPLHGQRPVLVRIHRPLAAPLRGGHGTVPAAEQPAGVLSTPPLCRRAVAGTRGHEQWALALAPRRDGGEARRAPRKPPRQPLLLRTCTIFFAPLCPQKYYQYG